VLGLAVVLVGACNDLRAFEGTWSGPRVADNVSYGVDASAVATLAIAGIDGHGIHGHLQIPSLVDADFASLPAAEADVLSTMTFSGDPMRVYLAFVPATGGDALAMVALYDSRRIEVRVLRGGAVPVYAIFTLSES